MSALDRMILDDVRNRIAREGQRLTPESVAAALRERGSPVGDQYVLRVHDSLVSEVVGAGQLEPLLRTPGVTDVLVNGADSVWIDRGNGLERQPARFADDEAVRRLAQRLAASAGRRLDDATPFVDARLADGSRLHAVLAPLSRTGTSISLRVPRVRVFTLDELCEARFVTDEGANLLAALVARKRSFLISGGTGSGKTTLLDALLSLVNPAERLVVIEDSAELDPSHGQVVCLEARPPNVEGVGAIPMSVLVRQAMRMRPDRLVVGEVRGAEVADLLAAMNTGHEGGCCTLHANSASDVPARIEALAMAAGLSRAAAHSQLAAAFDVVLHVARGSERRHLAEIGVLRRVDGETVVASALAFDEMGASAGGAGEPILRALVR